MQRYEYKVIPAPGRGDKARGFKSGAERFAHTIESLMNSMGAQGWEYVRADTLPAEERSGLTGRTTVYQNLLVFRRAVSGDVAAGQPGPAAEAAAPRLSFPRLRFGASREQAVAAPRIDTHAPEGAAPRLGPATDTNEPG